MPYPDYSDQERAAAWERAHAALDRCEESRREHEEWLAERERRALMGETERRVPDPPPEPSRAPRPRDGTQKRDWAAEQKWIEGIVDRRLAKLRGELIEAVGQALGQVRSETFDEVRRQLDLLREQILVEARRQLAVELEHIKDSTFYPKLGRVAAMGEA